MPDQLPPPNLILGTAQWGWTTNRQTAFSLLDEWYANGFREVDTATNYPIDKNPDHFRSAETILQEWVKANGITDLQVMMKIGSVNNLFTPEHILTKSFLLMMLDEYRHLFGSNLDTILVHWDNRESKDEIRESLEALETAKETGYKIGLSGIRYPALYAELNEEFNFDFRIQIKHNVLHSDYQRYASFHGSQRFITYGINAGGIKLDSSEYAANSTLKARGGDLSTEPPIVLKIKDLIKSINLNNDLPPIHSFFQIGMINAFYHTDVQGILLGTSKIEQLKQSTDFYQILRKADYSDVYRSLQEIINQQSTIINYKL